MRRHRPKNANDKDHVADETVQAYEPKHHRSNHLFRGTKADIWEAGHRVPFFARWPKQIMANTTNGETICSVDFLATVAEIIGAEKPAEAVDSFSLFPLFKGATWTNARDPVIHHSASGMFAIRSGKWKLVLGNGSGGREAPRGEPFKKPYSLFDLEADIAEENNLAETQKEVVARLEMELDRIRNK